MFSVLLFEQIGSVIETHNSQHTDSKQKEKKKNRISLTAKKSNRK
jgi:hypothetical protein